jgi:DNA-binding MarR family transcriptional regulator
MTDVEYSENYALYMTPHGVEYLTNQVSIGIMRLLRQSAMTVTELAVALDQQKTSIQSNLKKLETEEFVSSYIDENDRRRVIYVPVAMIIATPIVPSAESIHKNIIKVLLKKKTNKFRVSLLLTAAEFYKSGVSIGPLMERCGILLANAAKDDYIGKDLTSAIETIETNLKAAEFPPIKISATEDGITMITKVNKGFAKEYVLSIDVACGFISEAIKQSTGITFVVTDTDVRPDGKIVTKFERYHGVLPDSTIRDKLPSDKNIREKRLTICYTNGHSILFGNSVQTKIIALLSKEDAGLKAVTNTLGIPTVTAHRNLGILEQTGVITRVRGKTNTEFTMNGVIILTCNGKTAQKERANKDLFESCSKDPANYYEAIFGYINLAVRRTGFVMHEVQEHIGRSMAEGFINGYDIADGMTFLRVMHYAGPALGIRSKIACYIPLTISLESDYFTREDFEFIRPFYVGLISHGLKLTTGDDYNIRFVQDDPDYYKDADPKE